MLTYWSTRREGIKTQQAQDAQASLAAQQRLDEAHAMDRAAEFPVDVDSVRDSFIHRQAPAHYPTQNSSEPKL